MTPAQEVTQVVLEHRQKLPRGGPRREALREKGQFWTPAWIAEAMVGYVIQSGSDHVFDPAVGAGAFFRAAKRIGAERGLRLRLLGTEIDRVALDQGTHNGLTESDVASVQMQNFVRHPPPGPYKAIVANPPYVRHHRLSQDVKAHLRFLGKQLTGSELDGRAGLHVYFLLRALQLLDSDGRLAFILPADTFEGKSSPTLWRWITSHYRLEGVVTFTPEASPFPGVDTNAVIVLIRNAPPLTEFQWVRCSEAETQALSSWTFSQLQEAPGSALTVHTRLLAEGLTTGLSRPPLDGSSSGVPLIEFATVSRGIASGANAFFFLTRARARELGIPEDFLRAAIGRTRDLPGEEVTSQTVEHLDTRGRPTQLLSLGAQPIDRLPPSVRRYLQEGEQLGLPSRPLISQRRPWFKMEVRTPPAFLFAYLGRRHARFIRNAAGVVPLTGFLCVYPRDTSSEALNKLWMALQHPDTIANLALVGKSYGGGAIKVEPRALERLSIPDSALAASGLQQPLRPRPATLFDALS